MNIDELVHLRGIARAVKNWQESDRIRDYLDSKLVFVFDTKDGQDVHHLSEKYFDKKPAEMPHRKFVEMQMKKEIDAEKYFEAWLFSVKSSMKNNKDDE